MHRGIANSEEGVDGIAMDEERGLRPFQIYGEQKLITRSCVIRHLSEVSSTGYCTREHYSVNTMRTRYVHIQAHRAMLI